MLLITHDIEEAVSLSDRVIVLSHRPPRIRAVYDIELDGDRTDMMAARDSAGFTDYVRSIWRDLEVGARMSDASADCDRASTAPAATLARRALRPTAGRAARQTRLVLVCQLLLLAVFLGARGSTPTARASRRRSCSARPARSAASSSRCGRTAAWSRDSWVTGLETLLGFVVGNMLGTLLGLSLWYSRFVSRVVQPFIVALGSIPIIALAPIVIIWFGTGLASKIAMSTLSVVVVALVTSYKGAIERRSRPDQPHAHARRHEAPDLPQARRARLARRHLRRASS